jgi:hypothetical protein
VEKYNGQKNNTFLTEGALILPVLNISVILPEFDLPDFPFSLK